MGLVDHEQRRRVGGQLGPGLVVGQLLGGHEDELDVAGGQLVEQAATPSRPEGGVHGHGSTHVGVIEGGDLVLLQSDER
jgi:hypothetical protein